MCYQSELEKILYYTLLSGSIFSVIGCLFIVYIYFRYTYLRGLSLKIVLWISINDLVRSGVYIIPTRFLSDYTICMVYGIVINVAFTNNVIWAFYIVVSLYRIMFTFKAESKNYFNYVLLFTLVVVPLVHLIAIPTNSIGKDLAICTFSRSDSGFIFRTSQMGLIFTLTIISIFIYIKIYIQAKRYQLISMSELIFQKGMILAIITILISSFIMLIRILEFIYGFCSLQVPFIVYYALISLHGFFDLLGFLANNNIRRELIDAILHRSRSDSFTSTLIQ